MRYHIVTVCGGFSGAVCGTDIASIRKLVDDARQAPDHVGKSLKEPIVHSDHWAFLSLQRVTQEWAIAYLCREGWEPFAVEEGGKLYFRRATEE